MNLVSLSLRRPVTILVLVLAVVLGSLLAIQRMSRDIFPPLGVPTIYVAQPYGGMDPAQMEGYLTFYYEYHFLYITGIEHVESKTVQGASIMKLQFHPGTDMSQAMSETVSYVNRARAFMPPGTPGPFITRFDAGSVPVGYLVFSSTDPDRTVGQIQDAALNQVRPLFATLPGVSAPPPFGGSARTILVNLNPDRLRALGLSSDEVVKAMAEANVVSPSGNVKIDGKYPMLPVNAIPKNEKELESVPVKSGPNGVVFLRDIGTVQDGSDLVTSHALVNGRRTVYMPVTKRSDASTLSVVDLVKKNLPKFQNVLPNDVKVSFEFDQTPVVIRSIKELLKEGALGAILTGLMVLLFLRDWRSAFIVVINIPLSLMAATLALWLSGQNINLMTLGGLALAVGILVDESTVAVENIHAHLERGSPLPLAALRATEETALPRFFAMLCVLAVFSTAFFMTGPAQALFIPLALAVGFSMAASFLLSSTLVPILSIWFLRGGLTNSKHTAGFFERLRSGYESLLAMTMRLRIPLLAAHLILAIAFITTIAPRLGFEIFPQSDTGQFALRLRAPSGTHVDVTESLAKKALELIQREAGPDNVALTLGLVGVHAPNYPVNLIHLWNGGPEEAWLAVQLKDGLPHHTEQLKEKLRAVFASEMPSVKFTFEASDIVNRVMSFGSNTPVEVTINGPNLAANREHAEKLLKELRSIPALRDVQIAQTLDYPTLDVTIDRERAGMLGVKVSDVTRSLVATTTSSRFTTPNFWSDPKTGVSYNLQVQIPQSNTTSLEDIQNTPITSKESHGATLLRNIADIKAGEAAGQIERYNMARVVSITANIYNSNLGAVAPQIEAAIEKAGIPPAKTTVVVRGQLPPLLELLNGFRSGLLIAAVAVFLLLAANFQSFQLSLAVVSTLPAVLFGVVLMLWITGTTINIQSAIGAIMAIGVSVANAILLVTFAENQRMSGANAKEAAVLGSGGRLRPVLMTSCAMMAGMLPMALGLGEAGDQIAPLGRAVIGGLAASTLATLFVLPAIFSLLRGGSPRNSASLDATDPQSQFHQNFSQPSTH